MTIRIWLMVATGFLLPAAGVSQGAPLVSVSGLAVDSLHGTILKGAVVRIIGTTRKSVSDSSGRFVLDSVTPGKYQIVLQHEALDAIGLAAVGTRATVTDGRAVIIVAVPSFGTLWRAACGTSSVPVDSGFLFGSVGFRSGTRKASGAAVTASWLDVAYAKRTGVAMKRWQLETRADSTGNYAICGIPTNTGISIRASLDSSETGLIDVAPLDPQRMSRRDLDLGLTATAAIAQGRGATLRGLVLTDSSRQPISNAEVSLPDLGIKGQTDEHGAVRLDSIIPGSHRVAIRRIGYLPVETRLEFVENDSRDHTVYLTRVTELDSMRIKNRRAPADELMRDFADHQRRGFGTFFTRAQLDKMEGMPVSSVVAQSQGLMMYRGRGTEAWVLSKRAEKPRCPIPPPKQPGRGPPTDANALACLRAEGWYRPDVNEIMMGMKTACYATVYVDRVVMNPNREPFDVNSIPLSQIEAIEWFSGRTSTPLEYTRQFGNCGVLIIHTRKFSK